MCYVVTTTRYANLIDRYVLFPMVLFFIINVLSDLTYYQATLKICTLSMSCTVTRKLLKIFIMKIDNIIISEPYYCRLPFDIQVKFRI